MNDPLYTTLQVNAASPAAQRTITSFCDIYSQLLLTPEQAEFLSNNPQLARLLREVIQHCSTPAHDYRLGKSILGKDFITPQEVMQAHRGLIYTDAQLEVLHESRPNQTILETCRKDQSVISPSPPSTMSLHDITVVQPSYFGTKGPQKYYNEGCVMNERIPFGWMAIKKIPTGNATVNHWDEKIRYLGRTERVPRAVDLAWLMTTYAQVHRIQLFSDMFVLTASQFESGCRVAMGYTSSDKSIWVQPYNEVRGLTDWWPIASMRDISMLSLPS